ncbi:MAG TPA: DUF4255 domain-containing protein [Beijerinckiaceae bacterium]|jgi:hypothetical protein
MADHTAIAAVSRTLRTLLRDRMTVTPVTVTFVPPDVAPDGVEGARVNVYLTQVIENAELKNQEIPGRGHPAAYGRPPLSLNLRYLVTTYTALETQQDADINAQTTLGDVMRVLHDFGNRLDTLSIVNSAAGTVGDAVLDEALRDEYERIKLVLHPASIDDLTKVWSAIPEANFRRSVIYEATVVQIETPERRARPRPVEQRRIIATTRRRPVIRAAYVTPSDTVQPGELRVRIGDEITIETEHARADRLYVRLGTLDPIRVPPTPDGFIRIVLPDDTYAADLDGPAHPIPPSRQLQPGPLELQVIAEHAVEGVEGGLGHGDAIAATRRYASNVALLQLVPLISKITTPSGTQSTVLHLEGVRLWHPKARTAEVTIGDAPVTIRDPGLGDLWILPSPTVVEVPVADAAPFLSVLVPADPPYPVAVEIDGARSRDAIGFHLDPGP